MKSFKEKLASLLERKNRTFKTIGAEVKFDADYRYLGSAEIHAFGGVEEVQYEKGQVTPTHLVCEFPQNRAKIGDRKYGRLCCAVIETNGNGYTTAKYKEFWIDARREHQFLEYARRLPVETYPL